MNQERRIETRIPKRVMLSVKNAKESKPFMALTTNVSSAGMFIATDRLFPRGTRLVVAQTGDPQRTQIEVEVVRVVRQDPLLGGGQSGMGLRLVPSPQSAEAAPATSKPSSGTFALTFRDAAEFLEVLRRDLKHGGAFVRSTSLPQIHDVVTIAITIPLRESRAISFAARVVYRKEGAGADSGFGVEFLDRVALVTALLDPRRAA